MNQQKWLAAGSVALLAVFLTFGVASAHTGVTAGNYEIEVGWLDEPPLAGQRNAVVVNVSDTTAPDAEVDVSALTVSVTYGDESKLLTLQPLGEEAKNQYIAPLLPTIPGLYTVQLRGKLGDTDVNNDVQPEEVAAASTLAFPSANGTVAGGAGGNGTQGSADGFQGSGQRGNFGGGAVAFRFVDWYGIGGIVVGLIALVVSILAYRRKSA